MSEWDSTVDTVDGLDVSPPLPAPVVRTARRSALRPARSRRQLYADAELPIVDTSNRAEQLMHQSMTRSDFIEGITAFFQKRSPKFPPLAAHSDDT